MRMILTAAALTALTALAVSPVYAACSSPGAAPQIPDGTKATADDILAAHKNLMAFSDATTTYLACIQKDRDAAISAAGPSISTVQADKIDHAEADAHNTAVQQLNDAVERFNNQVQAFKTKQAADRAAAQAAAAAKKAKQGKQDKQN